MKSRFHKTSLKTCCAAFFLTTFVLTTSAFAAEARPVSLFQPDARRSATGLYLNQEAVAQLQQPAGSISLADVPLITGTTADFELTPLPVFASGAEMTLVKENGETESLPLPETRTWYGTNADDPHLALFLSANASGDVRVMVTGDSQSSVTVIARKDSGDEYGILPVSLPDQPFCDADNLIQPPVTDTPSARAASPRAPGSLLEIELMVDVSHSLYNQLNADPAKVAGYIQDLFGAVNTIYQRDIQARFTIVSVHTWTTPDPFNVNNPRDTDSNGDPNPDLSTTDQIYNYQDYCNANRGSVSRDLAHLLDCKPGFGGVAYLRILAPFKEGFRYGVSNVWADRPFPTDPADINSYYWDTLCVAHELGHNVGSQHTHCYSPPIDCCYITEGCSQCTTQQQVPGTIMSYCHLGNGVAGVPMTFHQRCYDEQIGPHLAAAESEGIISAVDTRTAAKDWSLFW